MYNFIHNKINIYGKFYGFYINTALYLMMFYTIYQNDYIGCLVIFLLKEFWHYLILSAKPKINGFNYHVYNGINILLLDINKRKGILGFYTAMYYLLVAMITYLLFVQDIIGIIIGSFVYISNLSLSLVFYKLSKSYAK